MNALEPSRFGQWSLTSIVRWGHGIAGKLSIVAVFLMVLLIVAIWRLSNEWLIAGTVLIAVSVFLYFVHKLLKWASDNPDLAVTEGPSYVQSRKLNYARKEADVPQITTLAPDPQNPTMLVLEDHKNGK